MISAGGSSFSDLLQATENYLSVLLGLVKEGNLSFYDFVGNFFYSYCYCSVPTHLFNPLMGRPFCSGSQLKHKVQFVWVNQEDDAEVGKDVYYKFLRILHFCWLQYILYNIIYLILAHFYWWTMELHNIF